MSGGISLSPSFVVMYVMQFYNLSWEDALHLVQNRRYCISPNGGFMTQIKVSSHPGMRHTCPSPCSLLTCGIGVARSTSRSTRPRLPSHRTRSSASSPSGGSVRMRTTRTKSRGMAHFSSGPSCADACIMFREGERTKRALVDDDDDDAMQT